MAASDGYTLGVRGVRGRIVSLVSHRWGGDRCLCAPQIGVLYWYFMKLKLFIVHDTVIVVPFVCVSVRSTSGMFSSGEGLLMIAPLRAEILTNAVGATKKEYFNAETHPVFIVTFRIMFLIEEGPEKLQYLVGRPSVN